MHKGRGRLGAQLKRIGRGSVAQIESLFAGLVNLKENFANPVRLRLFFPHKNFLAVPLSGARRRHILQGDTSQIPGMAGRTVMRRRII
jgi:hypothetical protein